MQVHATRGLARGIIAAVGAAALTGAALAAAPALGASGGGGCQLAGTANFDPPGLTAAGGAFSYAFTGSLTGCTSTVSGAPASGAIAAGHAYSVTANGTNAATGLPYSVTYALPQATGSGGCAESTTQGTGVVTWPDGTTTVVGYSTTGAAAAVTLSGTVLASATLTEIASSGSVPAGTPTTETVTSTNTAFPAGDDAGGALVFSVSDPTQCQTGVTTADINGVVGLGSAS